ncbi:MAG TPA: NHL repeat-containing protein [Armatimonadota bacterium]|nr:NHL repeat-containing protein [Armatimonadota bacterium]
MALVKWADVGDIGGEVEFLRTSSVDSAGSYSPPPPDGGVYEEDAPVPASLYPQLSSQGLTPSSARIPSQNADFKSSYSPCGKSSSMASVFQAIKDAEATGTAGVGDHGQLLGLEDDDHLQYLLLAGRAGGQIAYGGINSGNVLTLRSTVHPTKGYVYVGPSELLKVNNIIRIEEDSTDDPLLKWSLLEATAFTMGVDNSDSDKLKIANLAALGTLAISQGSYGESLVFMHHTDDDIDYVNLDDFATDGVLVSSTQGSGDGQICSNPKSLTYDGVYLYESDDTNNRVQKFDATTGAFVAKLAIRRPWGLCHWAGYLYCWTSTTALVGGAWTYSLYKIDAATMTIVGTYVFETGTADDEFGGPRGMCTDGTNLWICEGSNNRVKKTTMNGTYVNKVGSSGTGNGEFNSPSDCEVDGSYLYVCDYGNKRIQVFDKDTLAYVAQHPTQTIGLAAGSPASIAINDLNYYIGCHNTTPNTAYVEKYDIATRSYQASYDMVVATSYDAGLAWGLEIAKFASSLEKFGDLWVLHHDGSYNDVWPKVRLMDDLRLVEDGDDEDGDYVGLRAPAVVTASYSLTFPAADPGATKHLYGTSGGQLVWGQDLTTAASPTWVRATLTQATGTAPFTISSTTVVTNLNADLWDGYHEFMSDTLEPSGFEDRADSTITWDDGTLTLTITGTNFIVWYKGVRYLLNTDTSTIADTSGLYFFYYEISGATLNLTNSTVWPGFDAALVATVYWNTTAGMDKGLVADERHGIVMDAATHEWAHETIGVRYESGLAGTFTDSTFSIALGELHDEDLDFSITPAKTTCDVMYLDGSSTWKWLANQTVYYYTSGGNLYWNNGTTLTAAGANKYVAVWIFATTSPVRPIISIIGQNVSDTIADARLVNTYQGLSFGTLPFKEMKVLYRVILRNDVTPYEEAQDLRSISNISSGTYVATAHNTLTGLTTGDDHTQYSYVKISATAAPGVDDDITLYREGTIWIEQDANKCYILVDNTDGAAVWQEVGAGGGGAFLDLTDVDEADYVGHEGDFVVVNAGADGLEFSASSVADHDILSASHTDSTAAAVVAGDIIYGDDTPKWVRLAHGNDGDVLTLASGLPTWAAPTGGSLAFADLTDYPADAAGVLTNDGAGNLSWAAGGGGAHALLSATHDDSAAAAVSRGSIIVGDSTPAWSELTIGADLSVPVSDGTDISWNPAPSKLRFMISGDYHGSFAPGKPHPVLTNAAWTIAHGYATAFLVTQATSFDSLNMYIASGNSAGRLCMLGLYSDNGAGYPGTRLEYGEVDWSTTGLKTVAFASPRVLQPGLYWLYIEANHATPTIRSFAALNNICSIFGKTNATTTTKADYLYLLTRAYDSTLPNPFTAGAARWGGESGNGTSAPWVALHVT